MTVKKTYAVDDTVWIYGISKNNTKSTQGTVIKIFTIDRGNYNKEPHYLVEIPTDIEPVLEVRTWHTISQTKDGHVGSIRAAISDPDTARKFLSTIGVNFTSDDEDYTGNSNDDTASTLEVHSDIGPNEIHYALKQSLNDEDNNPLVTSPVPRKRPYFKKKKL